MAHINLRWTDDDEELADGYAWYYDGRSEILMDSRLGQRERRCVLGHELSHVIHRDTPNGVAVLDDMQELRADRWAARRLIEIRPLAEALAWSENLEEVAEELWVTLDLLEVRLRHLHPAERAYLIRRLSPPDHVDMSTESPFEGPDCGLGSS